MQRLLAILLLSVIGFLPVAPAWASSQTAAALPACCRAHGKHKCTMHAQRSEAGLYPVCSQCPVQSTLTSPAVNALVFPTLQQSSSFALLLSCPIAPGQPAARLSLIFECSCHKRGPPALLA